MKPYFIVNPRSGRGARTLEIVRAFAALHSAPLVLTDRPRHATELAQRALSDGAELIVAVGGDGTLNEIASIVTGTPATLGLIPCGSGNGLGRHLGIHGSIARALDILLTGQPRLIDTGLADGHSFSTAAGLGFEADISSRFNRLNHRGFLRYLTTSAQALREYQAQPYFIHYAGARIPYPAFTLVVANSDQYGNNARIAPGACVDDGLLNLTAVPPITWLNALPLLTHLFAGSLARIPSVLRLQAARFVVERPTAGPIHTDGEVHQAPARVEFVIRPASLRILTPSTFKSR